MAKRVLSVKRRAEQYRPELRDKLTHAENRMQEYAQKRLEMIQRKALVYVRKKIEPTKAQIPGGIFDPNDFLFDLAVISDVLQVGVGYQTQMLIDAVKGLAIPDSAKEMLTRPYTVQNLSFQKLLRERQLQLQDWLEETTFEKLYNITAQGVAEGLSYKEIADNLNTSLGINDQTRAQLIARTEVNYAMNEGSRRYVKDLGVTQYRISPAADACDECLTAAENVYDIDETGVLPVHPNCRCLLISVIPDDWLGE